MNSHKKKFPDYEGAFGRFTAMVKHIEREVGIKHYEAPQIETTDLEEIKSKELKAQRHEDYPTEEKFLKNTLKTVAQKIEENIQEYYDNLSDVIRRGNRVAGMDDWSDDPVMKGKMLAKRAVQNINQYKRAQNSPYFGKVLFQNQTSTNVMELYFGKVAVDLESDGPRVIDWRAPIADLYYKYTGPVKNAFFNVDTKTISGELLKKRQLTIENGTLTMISDGHLGEVIKELENAEIKEDSTDEILITNLNKSAHKRLGEIIATIQAKQNEIIRAPRNQVTLVQGVAGAGKTTIALHRLAYLMYNFADEIHPEKVMVIAPNSIFLDYISKILPDLGVEDINQTTIEDFILNKVKLPEDYEFWNKMEVSAKSYEDEEFNRKINLIRKVKGNIKSFELVTTIKRILEQHLVEIFEEIPYFPIHSWKVDIDYIRSLFYDHRTMPWNERVEYIKNKLYSVIENDIRSNSMNSKTANERIRSEVENLDKFFNELTYPTLIEVYRKLLLSKDLKNLFIEIPEEEINEIAKESIMLLDSGIIYSDDISLLFKLTELYNSIAREKFEYVVVDEAQDLTPCELQILKENCIDNALCIVGDINQTIHSEGEYQTITEQMGEVFGEENLDFYELLKSYRSTIEITEFANKILLDLKSKHIATPVIRHGAEPTEKNITKDHLIENLRELIKETEEKGRRSIVITTRTEKAAKEMHEELKNILPEVSYISDEVKNYEIGIHVMPSYLTKGLEFDTVIVVNNGENPAETVKEKRLEYVMYTRALHELHVLNVN